MKYLTAIVLAVVMLAIPFGSAFTALDLPDAGILVKGGPTVIPTFVITKVEADQWVEIQTDNFPAADHFTVTMGPMGAKGINGIIIGTTYSGPGGRFTMKYDIPPALKGSHQIAIRLESSTSGYFAYNWFYNANANVPSPTPVPPGSGYTGYPTFSIASVVKGEKVSITPKNFPPNDKFDVRMNWMGTRGEAGAIVETVTTNANGKLSDTTYKIPDFLAGAYQVAIRLESPTSGYYAYNWFYNNTTTGGTPPPTDPGKPSYVGYPTFAIGSVIRDKNVGIVPSNFPPNDSFNVRMNWMGTRGVGGTIVQTVTTDSKGNLSDLKYPIPGYLMGEYQIAIRLESPASGYYAFNWFYNNTYP
jgi:hypothetical protein